MRMRKRFHFDFTSCFRDVRTSTVWAVLCLAVCVFGVGISATAQWPPIIPINPPGVGTSAGLGTQGPGINPQGAVTGFFSDSNNVMHGFLRTPDGRITTFEAPGAGDETVTGFVSTTIPGVDGGQGTYAISINQAGAITGFYIDGSNVAHGFLRTPDGKFAPPIDASSQYAGTGPGQGTYAANINPTGAIAGNTVDGSGVNHGFVLADGKFTIFDAPHAGTAPGQGTIPEWASCINPAGAITGLYIDGGWLMHGFVRTPHGHIAGFEASGAGTSAGQGTWGTNINPAGAITGGYVDEANMTHGYVRAPDGTISSIDVPIAVQGTIPEGINSAGVIIGNYLDEKGANHGFVYTPDGKFWYFDVPGAGTGSGQGTIPLTNNDAGAITGTYIDDAGVIHGFLRPVGPPWTW
jgi:hypothetical protein